MIYLPVQKKYLLKAALLLSILHFVSIDSLLAQTQQQDSISAKRMLNGQYIRQYLRNIDFSYVSPGGEIGAPTNYVMSAKFNAVFFLLGTEKLPVAFTLEPEVSIRVRKEVSAGVRTPSYRLAGIAHIRLGQHIDHYSYLDAGFTHHSNGQDGPALNPDGSLNTKTGNFTTNYILANYRTGNFRPGDAPGEGYSINHSVGIQLHRLFRFEKAIKSDYGFTRLVYEFSLRHYMNNGDLKHVAASKSKEVWRLNAGFSYSTNTIRGYHFFSVERRANTEASFHYSLPFMPNTFLMGAIGYYGEDPYNIYYRNRYGYARFGISASLASLSNIRY